MKDPAPMPRKKARPTTPPPVLEDDNSLIDVLLAQIEDRQQPEQPQSLPPHSNPAPQKRNAKSRFLARQARKAAAIAQASPNVDPAAEERLQLEIREEEEAIKRTCDQLGLHLFHVHLLFLFCYRAGSHTHTPSRLTQTGIAYFLQWQTNSPSWASSQNLSQLICPYAALQQIIFRPIPTILFLSSPLPPEKTASCLTANSSSTVQQFAKQQSGVANQRSWLLVAHMALLYTSYKEDLHLLLNTNQKKLMPKHLIRTSLSSVITEECMV